MQDAADACRPISWQSRLKPPNRSGASAAVPLNCLKPDFGGVGLDGGVGGAATFVSAISATCLAALFMLSKAEVAAAIADLTALTATSEPAGAFLVAFSSRERTCFWKSLNCASSSLEISSFDCAEIS
jgi:hypothetical protein